MAHTNANGREISLKVVYYGPDQAGKATTLAHLHRSLRADARGQLFDVTTGADRTLFFDFLPPVGPRLRGTVLRVQLYTAPGAVQSAATHRALLEGVDGLVFVADSQKGREDDNALALERLRGGLDELGARLEGLPQVFAWNKRDLPDALAVEQLAARLNPQRAPSFETVATTGRGVFDTLKAICGRLIGDLVRRRPRPSNPGMGLAQGTPPGGNGAAHRPPSYPEPSLSGLFVPPALGETPAGPLLPATPPLFDLGSRPTAAGASQGPPSPTWLQPLHPEAALAVTARPIWLSQLVQRSPLREQIHEVELQVAGGHHAQAVRRAWSVFEQLAEPAPLAGAGEDGPALRAMLLGTPAARYLRFREAARHAESGLATSEDGLYALFFVLDAALRR